MKTMRIKIGNLAKDEIKESMRRCTSRAMRSAEAERLANLNRVSKDRIYAITREDRPKQKTRADKGKRTAAIMEHEGLKYAASLVLKNHLDPYKALRTVKEEGYEIPVADETFVRYLSELGLNRKNRRRGVTNHRRIEAELPGDVYQIDMSGLKARFAFDVKTRKIVKISVLDVSKNHPDYNKDHINVWRFVLVDDFSRRKFVRYVPVEKPNSSHFIEFFLEAYQEMGVPKILYTDNDVIIKYARTKRACEILNKALADSGGYEQKFHAAGNSRATGKVERSHQVIEQYERYLGLYIDRGRVITVDVLNTFAKRITDELNNLVHRTTCETPIDRWNSKRHEVRTIDAKILKSAFLVDEFDTYINGDLTIRHKGVSYQLPSDQIFVNMVAAQSKKNKIRIIFPDDADFFVLIDFDRNEYEIPKQEQKPDVFGEFKSFPEEISQKSRKELINFAKEKAKAEKQRTKEGHLPTPIPVIDTPAEMPKTNVAHFPKPTVDVTEKIIANFSEPQQEISKESSRTAYAGQLMSWYDAVRKFSEFFASKAECKEVLDTVYASRDDYQPETQVRLAVEEYLTKPVMPNLRLAQ